VSDIHRGLDLIALLCADTASASILVIDGEPKSKARPRLGKRGAIYTPSKPFEDAVAWKIKAANIPHRAGSIALGAVFYRPNFQRIDVDNMLKLVLDAGTTASLWDDDSQVTALMGVIEHDAQRPRTILAIGDHTTSFVRPITECPKCGTTFPLYNSSGNKRVYCSNACRYSAIRLEKAKIGQGRGPKRQPPATCADCGKELAKRTFVRCRECWRIARKQQIS
jgi:Holliday junction resolvase RusA-like endonuclease